MRLLTLVSLFSLLLLSACTKSFTPQKGVDYRLSEPPLEPFEKAVGLTSKVQPEPSKKQVEIVYLFWYGCPSCYAFEKKLNPWLQSMKGKVNFHYMPAPLGGVWRAHATLFWTASILGIEPLAHQKIFDTVQKERKLLLSPKEQEKFFSNQYQIDVAKFDFASREAQSYLKKSFEYTRLAGIRSVPVFIIDGRYIVLEDDKPDHMLKVAKALVEKVLSER